MSPTTRHILAAPAWPYANGPRHIGHVSGFGLPCDMFSQVPADGRQQGTDGQRHRRARHPDPGAGRRGGRDRPAARRPLQPRHRRRPGRPGHVLRPVHPDDHAEPPGGDPGDLHRALSQRLHLRPDRDGRDLAVHRPHAAGPLHRGHLPDLRLRQRPRRPVRQLRQPARPGRPDQPALEDQRRDAGVRGDRALLPRPARVRRRPRQLAAEQERAVAAERAEVLAQPAQ